MISTLGARERGREREVGKEIGRDEGMGGGRREEGRDRKGGGEEGMPNVMVALPNIGGALCSTPQSLADAHY